MGPWGVHTPSGIAEEDSEGIALLRADDGFPLRASADDAAQRSPPPMAPTLVLAATADSSRHEQVAHHGWVPRSTSDRGDAPGNEVAAYRAYGLAGEHALSRLPDVFCLGGGQGAAIVLVAEGPPTTPVATTQFGQFLALAPLPLRLVFALVACKGAELTGDHAPGGGLEIEPTGAVDFDVDTGRLDNGDEFLQLEGRAMEPIGVPSGEKRDLPTPDVSEQTGIFGSRLPRIRALVVVGIDADAFVGVAATEADRPAVLLLASHAEAGPLPVVADPAVDRGPPTTKPVRRFGH